MFNYLEDALLKYLLKRKQYDDSYIDLSRQIAREGNKIIDLFEQLKVQATIDTDNVIVSPTGNFVRYPIKTYGKIANINSVVQDIETVVSMHRRQETPVHLRKPMLALELPFPGETMVLSWDDATERLNALQPFQALLGMDYTSEIPKPAILDFGSKVIASGLISGASGSGKTCEAANLIVSLCHSTSPEQLQIIFCDPKFDEDYFSLSGLPHVTMINEPQDCIQAIFAVHAELERRKRQPSNSKVLLFIDEFADLKNGVDEDALSKLIAQITAVGRSKGIHLMLATQKPTTEIVDTIAKGNLTVRISGKVMTSKESEIAMGRGQIGCENLEGAGSFYGILGGCRVIRFQSYLMDAETLENAVNDVIDKWQDKTPLRINMDVEVSLGKVDPDVEMLQRIKGEYDYTDIFEPSGETVRGVRAKLLELLFGEGTKDANTPRNTLNRLLDKLTIEGW